MTETRTCRACPAPVQGKADYCDGCARKRQKDKNRAAAKAYRARKKKGVTGKAVAGAGTADLPQEVSGTARFLADYDAVCDAVARLADIPAFNAFATKAEAAQVIGRRAKNYKLQVDANRAQVLATFQLGRILHDMESAGELRAQGQRARKDSDMESLPPTLKEIGLDGKLAADAKKLATLDGFHDRLQAAYDAQLERGGRVSMKLLDGGASDKKQRRAAREAELAGRIAALPDRRYGVICADPEWRFEPWSRESGMDRAADNHYPTSTLDAIKARPVGDIAAKDCALFLWATAPMLPHALEVMTAWGFQYVSHVIWRKAELKPGATLDKARRDRGAGSSVLMPGTGYWFRNVHELLLVGTRGGIPAPAPGEQFPSIIDAPPAEHSRKPPRFAELIEAYYPSVPKIELNARGAAREGWDAWGNEAGEGS